MFETVVNGLVIGASAGAGYYGARELQRAASWAWDRFLGRWYRVRNRIRVKVARWRKPRRGQVWTPTLYPGDLKDGERGRVFVYDVVRVFGVGRLEGLAVRFTRREPFFPPAPGHEPIKPMQQVTMAEWVRMVAAEGMYPAAKHDPDDPYEWVS